MDFIEKKIALEFISKAKSTEPYALYFWGHGQARNCLEAANNNVYKGAYLFLLCRRCLKANGFGESIIIDILNDRSLPVRTMYEEVKNAFSELGISI